MKDSREATSFGVERMTRYVFSCHHIAATIVSTHLWINREISPYCNVAYRTDPERL